MGYIVNIFILLVIVCSVAADSTTSAEDIKRTIIESLKGLVCPPFGKKAKFEVMTIQTRSPMYGCAYMGNNSLLSAVPLFHLWLERPVPTVVHGHCNNMQNMDHYMFECLSRHSRPTNKYEEEMGWHYISLLEHTADENQKQNKPKTRIHRCALYDVRDQDDRMIRIIRMVISKPVIGDVFNASQCDGLSELMARDELPFVPEGYRYWPDGSLYIYLLGRKAKSFYTTTKTPEHFPVTSHPSTTAMILPTTTRPTNTTKKCHYTVHGNLHHKMHKFTFFYNC